MKLLHTVVVLVLVVSACAAESDVTTPTKDKDPIGDYTLIVEGNVFKGDTSLARLAGIMTRKHIPFEDATLTSSLLISAVNGTISCDNEEVRDTEGCKRGRESVPIPPQLLRTISIQRKNDMDFFITAHPVDRPRGHRERHGRSRIERRVDNPRDLGHCVHSNLETENAVLGEFHLVDVDNPTEDARLHVKGAECDGKLYVRNITTGSSMRTEAFCKSEDHGIVWIETANPDEDVVVHLDVVGRGQPPTLRPSDLGAFALPAVCLVRPMEASKLVGIDVGEQDEQLRSDSRDVEKTSAIGRMFKGGFIGAMAGLASSWFLPSKR